MDWISVQLDYLSKINLYLHTLETNPQNTMAKYLQLNSGSNSNRPHDPGKQLWKPCSYFMHIHRFELLCQLPLLSPGMRALWNGWIVVFCIRHNDREVLPFPWSWHFLPEMRFIVDMCICLYGENSRLESGCYVLFLLTIFIRLKQRIKCWVWWCLWSWFDTWLFMGKSLFGVLSVLFE